MRMADGGLNGRICFLRNAHWIIIFFRGESAASNRANSPSQLNEAANAITPLLVKESQTSFIDHK